MLTAQVRARAMFAQADPGRDRRIIPIRTSFPDQLLPLANS